MYQCPQSCWQKRAKASYKSHFPLLCLYQVLKNWSAACGSTKSSLNYQQLGEYVLWDTDKQVQEVLQFVHPHVDKERKTNLAVFLTCSSSSTPRTVLCLWRCFQQSREGPSSWDASCYDLLWKPEAQIDDQVHSVVPSSCRICCWAVWFASLLVRSRLFHASLGLLHDPYCWGVGGVKATNSSHLQPESSLKPFEAGLLSFSMLP